ncbi:FAD-binding and (Fe-S)-binding domain-containing protein [Pseudacidobacterium ailaaui]|uniref:FAD-binding and (Fe-S)-binding domain-containing protein n=1 Tax=Pseudacidobacterium ailaaui TaxID=1382359 RepID=UPI00047B6BD1|nr:FAD-binding and (Fe-S)-binding domain-containing protein [Pseudacidobacterium ailaaui]
MTAISGLPVLNNTVHSHESFRASQELEKRLRAVVRGEVRFDAGSRALYATDASNYRQVPIGLVVPRDAEDVIAALACCREFGAPVLARGGGTSLAGQCCNVAVVLDFSKYMRGIHWLDPERKLAHVEPGIVLDRVREAAEEHHLTFAPDPATHSRCTLGGMIGNNSCGVHALMGGKTVDNIHSLDVLLYDGTRMTVGATPEEELQAIMAAGGRRGEIYAGLRRIRDQYAELVRQKFPRIPRRVSGYNLDELLPENGFHVARALVGTEGTCVTVLGATLHLTPSPPHRRLVGLGFADPFIAADHVPFVLEWKPIGLEGFDGMLVDFMRRKRLALDDITLLPEGRGHLLVEFGGWTPEDAEAQVDRFLTAVKEVPTQARRYTQEEAPRVWHVRESALGSTVFVPGEPHGWEGWEDSAVPPEKLGAYLREIFHLLDEFGYRTPMYGHFGQGCVHMRINFDLESGAGIGKFRAFLDRATDIVLKHGGSISGEHGDGQARGALLPKMFGPELMQAFREFKALWDPENRMNPGKMVDPVAVYEPHENLRLGAGHRPAKPETYFQFPQDQGSFGEATLRCVGVGACRKQGPGTMCPSYMATREEMHSTRGRAHLLWEALEGGVLTKGWDDDHVREALDLCLSCKACKRECPVNVDIATYKAEFLAHYYERHRHPLRDYAFGFMDRWAHLASVLPGLTPRLANLPLRLPGVSDMAKGLLGIAPQRRLPRFAPRSYQSGLRENNRPAQVLLWPDTWNNYYHPEVLAAARQVLEDAGFSVTSPKRHVCCGRPLYDFGFLRQARAYLENTLRLFAREIDAGMPFVFLEPSCASVFRDELQNFFPSDARARRLGEQSLLLSEFLVRHAREYRPPSLAGRRILLHGHCHHKSLMKMRDEVALLHAAGAEVELLDSGCCGMAGPFGFEREKYEISQALGERVLLPAVRQAAPETWIVSDGFSCREQVAQSTERRALHLAEVLAAGSR